MLKIEAKIPEDQNITIYLAKKGFSISEILNIYANACPRCIGRLANEAGLNWGIEKSEFDESEDECIFCRLAGLIY